jgi:alkanesulfonate monooxygenase SsuD/methylene tetrahydromethanopterin reductase-like flavin-dependent oxidoreductase (luciferase family)
MHFGLNLPNMGLCSRPQMLADLAAEAEAAGWDGVFVWDSVYVVRDDPRNSPAGDPWIALAAIATRTQRVRIGPIITPLARRRPWKLARETVTLDHLSNGRLILPVGLGALTDGAFSKVNEETDRKIRAERLDEALEILTGLWSGRPFAFQGQHYQVDEMTFLPTPVQSPRIPIWVVGAWPRPKSMRRAVRYDGLLPAMMGEDGRVSMRGPTADEVRAMKAFVEANRAGETPFDIVLEGDTPGDDAEQASAIVRPYAEAGATWWLEAVWRFFYATPGQVDGMLTRIRQGPPRLR